MRLPRFRFTIRRMMIGVAMFGVVFGASDMMRRRDYYLGRYAFHSVTAGKREASGDVQAARYHRRRAYEFSRAARYPWLPIDRDPPGS